MPLHRRWNFDALILFRLTVSNGCDQKLRSITYDSARDDDHDRPVLQALFLALFRFIRPQVGIT